MGTTWTLRLCNPSMLPLELVASSVRMALDQVVGQMSTWEAESEISRFNRAAAGTAHALGPEFAEVLDCALNWASASGGAIDPTIGPLVALWGFGAHAKAVATAPSPAALAAAHRRVGWKRLAFDARQRTLMQPGGVWLDLSGIAKGFAVDHVAAALQRLGLRDFLIEVGGELRGAGRRPGGQPWQVRVESARDEGIALGLADMAVATSGDRWHAHEHGGRRWSHTIDPRSGESVQHTLTSVTVVHSQCMHADALATVLTVLGPEDGFAFAQDRGIAAVFVRRENGRHRTRLSDAWTTLAG